MNPNIRIRLTATSYCCLVSLSYGLSSFIFHNGQPETSVPRALLLDGVDITIDAQGQMPGSLLIDGPRNITFTRASKSGGSTLEKLFKTALHDVIVAGEGTNDNIMFKDQELNRSSTFIIGTVRNPCDWYISWWDMFMDQINEWGGVEACLKGEAITTDHWQYNYCTDAQFRQKVAAFVPPTMGDSDQSPTRWKNVPNKHIGSGEVDAFRHWITSPSGWKKKVSYNFWGKHLKNSPIPEPSHFCGPEATCEGYEQWEREYGERARRMFHQDISSAWTPESLADCWIHTETLSDDTKRCLHAYENIGGRVDWSRVPDLIENGNPRAGEARCDTFFDETAKAEVIENDRELFERFGYNQCCNSGNKAAQQ